MTLSNFLVTYAVGAVLGILIEREELRITSPGPSIEDWQDVIRFVLSALMWWLMIAMWTVWRDERRRERA